MSKIVDRDTFLYYLDNGDVNWEATARECIAKVFELGEENAKLKEKLEQIKNAILYCKETDYFALCKFCLKIIEGAEDE